MKTQTTTKNKKRRNKAGFGTIHVVLIVMFSGFSMSCASDIIKTVQSISLFSNQYDTNVEILNTKKAEAAELTLTVEKLNDPVYIKQYIHDILHFTCEGETIFVTQGSN